MGVAFPTNLVAQRVRPMCPDLSLDRCCCSARGEGGSGSERKEKMQRKNARGSFVFLQSIGHRHNSRRFSCAIAFL